MNVSGGLDSDIDIEQKQAKAAKGGQINMRGARPRIFLRFLCCLLFKLRRIAA
jgi:hypothetical protein